MLGAKETSEPIQLGYTSIELLVLIHCSKSLKSFGLNEDRYGAGMTVPFKALKANEILFEW